MEKQITVIVKWTLLIGLTFFALGIALKSLYFYKLIETPYGSNFLFTLGSCSLAVVCFFGSFVINASYLRVFRMSFGIFLIGSYLFFVNLSGGILMLTISSVLILLLILLLFMSKRNTFENETLSYELLFMMVILFLMVFYFISLLMYYRDFLTTLKEASHGL
jgi:hypothetical protein